jgi:hypothetical protein
MIRLRVHEGAPAPAPDGERKQRVIIREGAEPREGEETDRLLRKMVEGTIEPSADGTTRRKVTIRGEGGGAEGTLELSVRR